MTTETQTESVEGGKFLCIEEQEVEDNSDIEEKEIK